MGCSDIVWAALHGVAGGAAKHLHSILLLAGSSIGKVGVSRPLIRRRNVRVSREDKDTETDIETLRVCAHVRWTGTEERRLGQRMGSCWGTTGLENRLAGAWQRCRSAVPGDSIVVEAVSESMSDMRWSGRKYAQWMDSDG